MLLVFHEVILGLKADAESFLEIVDLLLRGRLALLGKNVDVHGRGKCFTGRFVLGLNTYSTCDSQQ